LIVIGNPLMPLTLKPVPLTLTCETATEADPVFDKVIVCELLLFELTVPKLATEGFAMSWPWTPAPLSVITAGEFGALLKTEMLPVTLPAVVGAKVAAKVKLAPGLIDCVPKPLKPKPVPEAAALVMFTTAFPELVRVMFCEVLLPTEIFPNGTFVGLIVKPGCDCVAVPLSEIASGEPGALLTIETLPLAAPATVGANFTLNEVL